MQHASYAVQKQVARGRFHDEPESDSRTPWQRDRDRIVHSTGFRKLQYKTQVFINHEGDFFRTRLTHSLEVAQIARSIARFFSVDEDMTEALALAHDLGHTPFGHAGEDALAPLLARDGGKGFDHNIQSFRQVTRLERCYLGFHGLNLTWETLEGLVKHNGPMANPPEYMARCAEIYGFDLTSHASIEAQIASLSDDIAYNAHDLDDGLRAGILCFDDIAHLPVIGTAWKEVTAHAHGQEVHDEAARHELMRRVINMFVKDLQRQTRRNLDELRPQTSDDVRACPVPVVSFSAQMTENNRAIKAFLRQHVYQHWRVQRMTVKARKVTQALFSILEEEIKLLPDYWRKRAVAADNAVARRRIVADYIAGMTDRLAMEEYKRLTDLAVAG